MGEGTGSKRVSLARRVASAGVVAILVLAALYVADFVYHFGQTRFLTIDEFQWGHLAWLVSEGQVPYRDFYEHHLPLGYLFHSLFIDPDAGFVEKTLLLRKIAFVHWMFGMCALGVAAWFATRNVFEALLCMIVPAAFGFSLMTAIEFRGDNWAAVLLLACLACIEVGQRRPSRALSVAAGLLLGCAVFVTQKIVVLGALAAIVMALVGMIVTGETWKDRFRAQIAPHPWLLCAAAALVAVVMVAIGAGSGVLEQAYQANVLDAIAHEELYGGFEASRYLSPFLKHTAWTTWPIAGFAVFYLLGGLRRFWSLPLVVAVLGAATISAPYPYNFVYVSLVAVSCAVRGFCDAARWLGSRVGLPQGLLPLVYLLPLLVIPDQLGFLSGTTPIDEQLELLAKIEQHSDADEVVIDSAGSALFRPHRSYYWYQGKAHRKIYDDYYRNDFVQDLRATKALFHIRTHRTLQLPAAAEWYLNAQYTRFDRDLFVLGFRIPRGQGSQPRTWRWEVIRSGEYYLSVAESNTDPVEMPPTANLEVDGKAIEGGSVYLEEGWHEFQIAPDAPRHRLSFLPPSAFGDTRAHKPTHTGGFEFRNADERLGKTTK